MYIVSKNGRQYVHMHMGGGESAPMCKGQSSASGAVLKHRAPYLGDRVFLWDLGA